MADVYYEEMRRKFYTTPSSYLELINLYTTMLIESREKINQGKLRIQNGLQVSNNCGSAFYDKGLSSSLLSMCD